jgi:hypothetical protein
MPEKEPMKEQVKFIEKTLTGDEPPRCVDGRPSDDSLQGPQFPGGSLFFSVMKSIIENDDISEATIKNDLETLGSLFPVGVHRGPHKDIENGKSDCGFADKQITIIQTAKDNPDTIIGKLEKTYKENGIDTKTLRDSFNLITNYDLAKATCTGEKQISSAESCGATSENLKDDHKEMVAFVNLKPNTTLDTRKLNEQGQQAFNLDLWAVFEQGQTLIKNVSDETLRDLALILYQATEMVLVEQKGKPALKVEVHK